MISFIFRSCFQTFRLLRSTLTLVCVKYANRIKLSYQGVKLWLFDCFNFFLTCWSMIEYWFGWYCWKRKFRWKKLVREEDEDRKVEVSISELKLQNRSIKSYFLWCLCFKLYVKFWFQNFNQFLVWLNSNVTCWSAV